MVTTNLPLENWTEVTEVLGSERPTGATLDRLVHRCNIIETKGESYRLQDAAKRSRIRKSRETVASATFLRQTESNQQVLLFSMHRCCCFGCAFTLILLREGGSINTPVDCGGLRVLPGTLVIADEDGILVLDSVLASDSLHSFEAEAEEDEIYRTKLLSDNLPSQLSPIDALIKGTVDDRS